MTGGEQQTLIVTSELQHEMRRGLSCALGMRRVFGIVLWIMVGTYVFALVLTMTMTGVVPALSTLAIVKVCLGIVAFGGLQVWRHRQHAAMVARACPVGSELSAALTDDGLRLTGPTGSSTISYQNLRHITRHGAIVVMRTHVQPRLRMVQPGALFTDQMLAELHARMQTGR